MYIVSEQQAGRIRSFVQNGGTFIAGFRLGVKDEHSRIVATPLPGLLRDVMGVEHLLLGSDWPHPEGLREPRAAIMDYGVLEPDEQRLALRENLRALSGR